ncbi:MAG TPA: SDR family oxidoreductase [Rhizorhapis sp.]|nr:SDR family oxidoreductase [Rhizorhapis sp.]
MAALNITPLGPRAGARLVLAGGAGGIGRALTDACLANGYEVAVLDLAASIDAHPRREDVHYVPFEGGIASSIEAACAQVAVRWKAIDGFVFLSGFPILPRRPLTGISVEQWDELMAVNLRSAYLLWSGLAPLLEQADSPAVVTVASSLGYQVMPGMGAYASSKAGLVGLTKAIAMESAPRVRANAVAPGAVDTDFLGGGTGRPIAEGNRSWFDDMADRYAAMIPLGRVAEPDDIVGPILFLLGPASSYMTGQVLHLNGGRLTP